MTTEKDMTNTNKINGVDLSVLKKTVGAVSENPEMGQCEFRVSNEWVNGDSNRSSTETFYAACSEQQHQQTALSQIDQGECRGKSQPGDIQDTDDETCGG